MTVFVLTQSEKKTDRPVGVVSREADAQEWTRRSENNDFFPLEVDDVGHLGMIVEGAPAKRAPINFPMPPDLTGSDPNTALAKISAYMVVLADSMEEIQIAANA